MEANFRDVSPETAKKMLKKNPNNRPISIKHVDFLSDEMLAGNWMCDAQPLRFTQNSSLLDGQHRLSAIVKSGTTQKFLIVTGVPAQAFKVMDTGKLRGAGDVFAIHGIVNYHAAAAVSREIVAHKKKPNYAARGYNKISNTELLNFYNENPSVKDLINKSTPMSKGFNKILSISNIASYMFLMGEKHAEDSEKFWKSVCFGLSLEVGSPILALRTLLINDKISETKFPPTVKKAYVIKAWNHFRKNDSITSLNVNLDRETFPVII